MDERPEASTVAVEGTGRAAERSGAPGPSTVGHGGAPGPPTVGHGGAPGPPTVGHGGPSASSTVTVQPADRTPVTERSLGSRRLDDPAVRERLTVLDEQLARLEEVPGPIGELALAAVSGLAEIYGQALGRVLDLARELAEPAVVERMLGDELLGHLLTLHGLHPESIEERVRRVIAELRRALAGQIADIELVGIDHTVAIVRLAVRGCGSGAGGVERAVRDAVLVGAPELSGVAVVPDQRERAPTFVPLESLLRTRRPPDER